MNGYYVCENGSFIYDKDYNVIFKRTIDDNLVKKSLIDLSQVMHNFILNIRVM